MTARSRSRPRAGAMLSFDETPGAFFFGGGGQPPAVEAALAKMHAIEAAQGVTVHIVDAAAVCGPAHLASALAHARRARERGRPKARDAKVELMLYLSGQRQIAKAIEAVGLKRNTHGVGFAVEGDRGAAERAMVALLHALDLSRSDDVLSASATKARAAGAVGTAKDAEGWETLAIEAVAMMDID